MPVLRSTSEFLFLLASFDLVFLIIYIPAT